MVINSNTEVLSILRHLEIEYGLWSVGQFVSGEVKFEKFSKRRKILKDSKYEIKGDIEISHLSQIISKYPERPVKFGHDEVGLIPSGLKLYQLDDYIEKNKKDHLVSNTKTVIDLINNIQNFEELDWALRLYKKRRSNFTQEEIQKIRKIAQEKIKFLDKEKIVKLFG